VQIGIAAVAVLHDMDTV